MNTKILMSLSALVMGVAGVSLSFLPQEILTYFGISPEGLAPLFLQVVGALYAGIAMMNWMTREAIIGGIYNRPIAMANMMNYTIGAAALLKGLRMVPLSTPFICTFGVYALFSVWFGLVMFRHPGEPKTSEPTKAPR